MQSRKKLMVLSMLAGLLALGAGSAEAAVYVGTVSDPPGDGAAADVLKVAASYDDESGVVGVRFTLAGSASGAGEATFRRTSCGAANGLDMVASADWGAPVGNLLTPSGVLIAAGAVTTEPDGTLRFQATASGGYRDQSYACVDAISLGGDEVADIGLSELVVAEDIRLDRAGTYFLGDTVAGRILWRNNGPGSVTMISAQLSALEPGRPHGPGQDKQFKPVVGEATLSAGQPLEVKASFPLQTNYPLGRWEAFGNWLDEAGVWHESEGTSFNVLSRDRDGDNVIGSEHGGPDCDDGNPAIRPGAPDPFGNGVDENCDRADGDIRDGDRDGALPPAHGGRDCNDANPAIRPGAPDAYGNGVDENCDGGDGDVRDADHDGVLPGEHGGGDCNDANADIAPGKLEIPGNRVDENCDDRIEPYARLRPLARYIWTRGPMTRSKRFLLEGVPAGATVKVSCSGSRDCPRRSYRTTVRTGPRSVDIKRAFLRNRRFRAGTQIEVRVTQPERIGLVVRSRMRARGRPKVDLLCLPPGADRPVRCD